MTLALLNSAALLAYLFALLGWWRSTAANNAVHTGGALYLLILAWLLHALVLAMLFGLPDLPGQTSEHSLNVHIIPLFSLTVWLILGIGWLMHLGLRQQLSNLQFSLVPLALLAVLLHWLPQQPLLLQQLDWLSWLHIICSIMAYCLLSIAALLALQIRLQHWLLKHHQGAAGMQAMPLTASEQLLFRLLLLGVLLLTVSLLSGLMFIDNLFAQHLIHKTVLSMLAWLIFSVLLVGRWRYGWRGLLAIKLTLAGMLVLLLAYFGSKLVLEVILDKDWQLHDQANQQVLMSR